MFTKNKFDEDRKLFLFLVIPNLNVGYGDVVLVYYQGLLLIFLGLRCENTDNAYVVGASENKMLLRIAPPKPIIHCEMCSDFVLFYRLQEIVGS